MENAGLGRYLINLVDGLVRANSKDEFVILLQKKYFDSLKLSQNWKKVEVNFRHYSFAEQFKLTKIITDEKPDITHFPHFNVPIFFRGKYVVTIHDMLMHKSVGLAATTLPAPMYLVKRLGYRVVFDNAVRRAQLIIVPSNAVKKELIDLYHLAPGKIAVTYEGVDAKISKGKEVFKQKPYFAYVGNAYPHKNLGNLILAIKLLNTNSIQKVFLAISSARNIFTQRIENMTKKAGSTDLVKFLGYTPNEELGSLLEGSIGLATPSFSEGFGLPGLEAMGTGTLVLASDIPVFQEVYGENAIYFNPASVVSIEEALEKALKLGSIDREKRIAKGKDFVKRYSWDKMAQETLKIYEESSDCIRQSK
jgi:glycosyltransferase involved in cell wall biosynthesis